MLYNTISGYDYYNSTKGIMTGDMYDLSNADKFKNMGNHETYRPNLLNELKAKSQINHHLKSTSNQNRQLFEYLNDDRSKSNLCKTDCIDANKIYCPSDLFFDGYCYEDDEIWP